VKIKSRIILLVGLTALMTTALITLVVVKLAGDTMEKDARQVVNLLTERFAMRIRLKVETGLERAKGLARGFAVAGQIDQRGRAAYLDSTLARLLDASPEVSGAWALLDALPGEGRGYARRWDRGATGLGAGGAPTGLDEGLAGLVRDSGLARIFEPRRDAGGGTSILLGLASPVMVDGSMVGVVGLEISMNEIDSMVSSARVWKDSYGYLVSTAGTYIIHPEAKTLGGNIFQVGGFSQAQEASLRKAIASRGSTSMVMSSPTGGDAFQSYFCFPFSGTNEVWTFAISVPLAETRKDAVNFAFITLGTAALVVLLGLISAFVMGGHIARPLVAVRDAARRMASNRDLGFGVTSVAKDETGESVAALEELFGDLRAFVAQTSSGAEDLRASGEKLAAAMKETTLTTEHIAESAGRGRKLAESQGASTQEVAAGAHQIARRAEELSATAARQAEAAARNGEALHALAGGAKAVENGMRELNTEFAGLVSQAASGGKRLEAAAAANSDVERRSEDLLAANRALATVAAKTNILAMNAAIEAAHAGQYGRGFAVVAGEIRGLAEMASTQSRDIEKTLKVIKSGIHGASDSSLAAREAFAKIEAVISRANDIQERIGTAVAAQAAAFSTAEGSVAEGTASSREVAAAAAEMKRSGHETAVEMEALVKGGLELLAAIDDIETGAQSIAAFAGAVAEQSLRNKERLDELASGAAAFGSGAGEARRETDLELISEEDSEGDSEVAI